MSKQSSMLVRTLHVKVSYVIGGLVEFTCHVHPQRVTLHVRLLVDLSQAPRGQVTSLTQEAANATRTQGLHAKRPEASPITQICSCLSMTHTLKVKSKLAKLGPGSREGTWRARRIGEALVAARFTLRGRVEQEALAELWVP